MDFAFLHKLYTVLVPAQVYHLTDEQVHSGCPYSRFVTPGKLFYTKSVAGRGKWVYVRETEPQNTNNKKIRTHDQNMSGQQCKYM